MIRDFHEAIMDGGGYVPWFFDGILGIAFIAAMTLATLMAGVSFIEPAVRAQTVETVHAAPIETRNTLATARTARERQLAGTRR